MECPLDWCCINSRSVKCSLCMSISRFTERNYGYEHYPAFKDKMWYAKTIPYFNLKPLFDR